MQLPFESVQKNILERKESLTDPAMGYDPHKRPISMLLNHGVININKPKGPTSHQVSDYVQRILGIDKSGHGGTLDPGVTGVLPIAIGKATRIVQALLPAGKEYVCIMHTHQEADEQELRKVMAEFTGTIRQLPPIKSAVKREERERVIYYLEILEIDGKDILFMVGCQAGTYIRKLCHDIGKRLGCGAHMAELRRTKAGCFTEKNIFSLQELTDSFYYYKSEGKEEFLRYCLQPVESALKYIPKCWVLDTALLSISHGRDLSIPGVSKLENFRKSDVVAIMSLKGELIAIGEAAMSAVEINTQTKGMAVKVKKVFKEVES